MAPLRTLHVIDSLGGGGAEFSLRELVAAFAARGAEPTVAVLGERAESDEVAVPVHRLPTGRVRRTLALRRLIVERRPDVVHTTLFESDVSGRIAAWRTGVPVVTSLVNTSYDAARRHDPNVAPWKLAMVRAVEGWTARHLTTRFHAISEAVAAAAVDTLGIDWQHITVVPRGRDPRRLGEPSSPRRAEARARLGLADDERVVTTVGRQEFQKGQHTLVEAVARIEGEVTLLVVGRPGAAPVQESERVRVLGHRADVPDILAASDVFAFPSRYEGLGGAVLEAMALALPVVASDLPALREVVEPGVTGLLVPADDPDAWAAALADLLADGERRARMGAAGRARFLERFTLDAVVDPMLAVLTVR